MNRRQAVMVALAELLGRAPFVTAQPACRPPGHPCEGHQPCCSGQCFVGAGDRPGRAKRCGDCVAPLVLCTDAVCGECCDDADCPEPAVCVNHLCEQPPPPPPPPPPPHGCAAAADPLKCCTGHCRKACQQGGGEQPGHGKGGAACRRRCVKACGRIFGEGRR